MKILNKLLIISILSAITLGAGAQKAYKVLFRIKGVSDTNCLIANYYGNGTYIKDTVKVDKSGKCTFSAPADLPKGIYIFIITDKVYFDFIINNDKEFSMECDKSNPLKTMSVKGSQENTLFYDYLKFNKQEFDIVQKIQKELDKHSKNPDSAKMLSDSIGLMNNVIIQYKLNIVKKYPDSFLAFMINIMKEPEVPEAPLLQNGRKDSTFAYRYYRAHFWDDVDFADDRDLRTPVFHTKLVKYFDKVLPQSPDTIIRESDYFIEKARINPEMFKYLVWFVTRQYENSEIMGFDKIFVHVVNTYYITNQTPWVNETVKKEIIKKSSKMEALLIGKRPPNMIMQDTSLNLVSMYNVNAKTLIILFWDPECGHCEQEVPKLKALYDKDKGKYGLEIFSVCSDSSMVKMKNYIRKKNMSWINVNGPRTLTGEYHGQYDITSTPVIYILNEQKEIIAKRLSVDQIDKFLENYYKSRLRK
ncbi:MAG: thioredoxin-like domain-containing protein [Bacteroidota bacterium]